MKKMVQRCERHVRVFRRGSLRKKPDKASHYPPVKAGQIQQRYQTPTSACIDAFWDGSAEMVPVELATRWSRNVDRRDMVLLFNSLDVQWVTCVCESCCVLWIVSIVNMRKEENTVAFLTMIWRNDFQSGQQEFAKQHVHAMHIPDY